jgi:hypothetical protein
MFSTKSTKINEAEFPYYSLSAIMVQQEKDCDARMPKEPEEPLTKS